MRAAVCFPLWHPALGTVQARAAVHNERDVLVFWHLPPRPDALHFHVDPGVLRFQVHRRRRVWTGAGNALVIAAPALLVSLPGTDEVVEPGMAIVVDRVLLRMQVLLVQVLLVQMLLMHMHRCLDPGPVAMHLVVLPPVALSWLQFRLMLAHATFAFLATAPSFLSVRPCRIEVGQGSIAVKGYRTAKVLVGTAPALFLF